MDKVFRKFFHIHDKDKDLRLICYINLIIYISLTDIHFSMIHIVELFDKYESFGEIISTYIYFALYAFYLFISHILYE
mgnify:CR=1 FL=1